MPQGHFSVPCFPLRQAWWCEVCLPLGQGSFHADQPMDAGWADWKNNPSSFQKEGGGGAEAKKLVSFAAKSPHLWLALLQAVPGKPQGLLFWELWSEEALL